MIPLNAFSLRNAFSVRVFVDRRLIIFQEIAVLISAGLREWIDFGVIIGILLLNATVGWYQEKQAADVVASLKGDIAMKAVRFSSLSPFETTC